MPENDNERLAKILRALRYQTELGNLEWTARTFEDSDENLENYDYSTEGNTITIGSRNAKAQERYLLTIKDSYGRLIATIDTASTNSKSWPQHDSSDPWASEPFDSLRDVFARARRKALEVDNNLDQVLRDLEDIPPF